MYGYEQTTHSTATLRNLDLKHCFSAPLPPYPNIHINIFHPDSLTHETSLGIHIILKLNCLPCHLCTALLRDISTPSEMHYYSASPTEEKPNISFQTFASQGLAYMNWFPYEGIALTTTTENTAIIHCVYRGKYT